MTRIGISWRQIERNNILSLWIFMENRLLILRINFNFRRILYLLFIKFVKFYKYNSILFIKFKLIILYLLFIKFCKTFWRFLFLFPPQGIPTLANILLHKSSDAPPPPSLPLTHTYTSVESVWDRYNNYWLTFNPTTYHFKYY